MRDFAADRHSRVHGFSPASNRTAVYTAPAVAAESARAASGARSAGDRRRRCSSAYSRACGDGAAAVRARRNLEARRNALRHCVDVSDDADAPVRALQALECIYRHVERRRIERAEALVDEDRLEPRARGVAGRSRLHGPPADCAVAKCLQMLSRQPLIRPRDCGHEPPRAQPARAFRRLC